jgi:hypothetical protein
VPVGDGTGRHLLHLLVERRRRPSNREGHDPAAIGEEDPPDRPSEEQRTAAVLDERVPLHQPRKRQRPQRGGEDVRQHVDDGPAPLPPAERQVDALWRLGPLQRTDRHLVLGGKPLGRPGRSAVALERRRDRRTGHQFFQVGLTFGQPRHPHGQPPRRAVGFRRRVGGETKFLQLGEEHLADLVGERREPSGRNLFAADLEQEFAFHGYADSPAAVLSAAA